MAPVEQHDLSGRGAGPLRLAIIADDLTGALDAAAPFADAGLQVRVATRPAALALALAGAEVVAVSTRSREISAGAAARAVEQVLDGLPPGVALFKKVDSRLKGHIAVELAALGRQRLLVVPALPEFGRVVRGGSVQGHGVAVPIPVAPALGAAAARALIPDVETPQAMQAALAAAPGRLVVGARGAALALAQALSPGLRRTLPTQRLPMVFAVGSTDPITLAQVAHLRSSLDPRHVAAPDGAAVAEPAPGVTVLQAVAGAGATGPQVALSLANALAVLAGGARSLVLTGGATAEAALDRLGVDVLDLYGDLLPGLPLSRAGDWQIVTKSGGFGGPETLTDLARGARTE